MTMNVVVDLSSGLSSDYEKLYENGKYADVSIHVGKEPNNKIFLAHTLVLCTRSAFLENSLTGNTETSEEIQSNMTLVLEDVPPEVFEIILRFIYTGKISSDSCRHVDWISLMDCVIKFELLDLLTAVEAYLINKQKDWIQHNILTVHKYALAVTPLNRLLRYCNRLIISHPDIVFKSDDLATLPKKTLISLLKNDDLNMDEDDIWLSVVQWATKQVPELELGIDLANWSSNDINIIKDIIADCIPHIRFFYMSAEIFLLFDDLLPKTLRHDVLTYHIKRDSAYIPNAKVLPPRTGQRYCIDSLFLNKKQVEWISSKIVESTITRQIQENQATSVKQSGGHKFTLLYRKSRDGGTVAKFRELCNDKGPTITVGKVLGTEEILGGYNPIAWGSKTGWGLTKESFIFALNKSIDKSIVSFVDRIERAIDDSNSFFPRFGNGCDLSFGNDSNKLYAKKKAYQVPVRSSSDHFIWADWEVFSVSRH